MTMDTRTNLKSLRSLRLHRFAQLTAGATLFLIFIKWVPCVSLYEVKETLTPRRRVK